MCVCDRDAKNFTVNEIFPVPNCDTQTRVAIPLSQNRTRVSHLAAWVCPVDVETIALDLKL